MNWCKSCRLERTNRTRSSDGVFTQRSKQDCLCECVGSLAGDSAWRGPELEVGLAERAAEDEGLLAQSASAVALLNVAEQANTHGAVRHRRISDPAMSVSMEGILAMWMGRPSSLLQVTG